MTYPSFTSGDILTAADMNAVGLWLVKTQTVGSAVASVAVTGAFSSTYDNYRIMVNIDAITAGGPYVTLQLGATTTGYYYGAAAVVYSTAGFSGLVSNNQASFNRLGPANSGSGGSLIIDVLNPNRAYRTVISSSYADFNTAGSAGYGSGFLNNTTQYTDFTIGLTSSTMTGGNIRVYGYKNGQS
jgi:hypothetical protein